MQVNVHVDHYSQNEAGARKEIRDQCVRQLTAIRGLNIPGGEKLVCPDAIQYLFLLRSVEEKSVKYEFYFKTSIIGGAFIYRDDAEIIMHPHHMSEQNQLLGELDKIYNIDRADRNIEVRREMN